MKKRVLSVRAEAPVLDVRVGNQSRVTVEAPVLRRCEGGEPVSGESGGTGARPIHVRVTTPG